MSSESEQAIDRAKGLLEDAETFHLSQIALPVKTIRALVALAEIGARGQQSQPEAGPQAE